MDSSILHGIIESALQDITKNDEIQKMVKDRIISPIFQSICKELYVYIYIIVGVVAFMIMLLIVVTVILLGQIAKS